MAKKRLTGLGSLGIDALLSVKVPVASDTETPAEYAHIGIECICPNRYQPRTHMDQQALDELAESIKHQGLIQPLLVRPLSQPGQYELVAGERRWRAVQKIGLEKVPVIIRDMSAQEAAILALVENIQRTDLEPLDEAAALRQAVQNFHLTHEEVAGMVGRSRPAVSNLMRLLELDETVQQLFAEHQLEEGQARVLLRLPQHEQPAAARRIISQGMTVRQAEYYVAQLLDQDKNKKDQTTSRQSSEVAALEHRLQERFGTPINIRHRKSGGGQIIIRYANLDVLDGILEKLH